MKNKILKLSIVIGIFTTLLFTSCLNLDEKVYSSVMTTNYYSTKDDVIRAVYRPFEHGFSSVYGRFELEELPADQLITPTRDDWWYDTGKWERYHYHTWTIDDETFSSEWTSMYQGIGQVNLVLDDLSGLNPSKFGFTQGDFDYFIAQNKTLRAYYYIRLLNAFRNIILTTTSDEAVNSTPESRTQVAPQVVFDFIEDELEWALETLPAKEGNSGNGKMQGQFTKAAAASLLVRLYLNAEKWTGTAKWSECANMAQRIIDGEFGQYEIDPRWDAPFDWENEYCNEVIFAFPGTYGGTHWHYRTDHRTIYWRCNPYGAEKYYGCSKEGTMNPKYACSPSYDLNMVPYKYKLGVVSQKFEKYSGDIRYKKYENKGNSTREGMFLWGKLAYKEGGETKYAKSPSGYTTYLRDQVGRFRENAEAGIPQSTISKLSMGDHNSGIHPVKYPFYASGDQGCMESDFVEIRLAEIYYSLAECKLRQGDANTAGKLLNAVRKRNYDPSLHEQNLYAPEGKATLNMDEMLDEWGREFLAEGRRRTDLIRFGKFCTEAWWDKEPDADNHWEIYPFSRRQLSDNHYLKQNPGYESISY